MELWVRGTGGVKVAVKHWRSTGERLAASYIDGPDALPGTKPMRYHGRCYDKECTYCA